MARIYLDHAASTAVDPRVLEQMLPYFGTSFGNASSLHELGREGREAVDSARARIAASIGASRPEEVVFTSGGTESNNLALKGVALANRRKGRHIITSRIEHDSVLNSAAWLEGLGFAVTYLDVDEHGSVRPEALAAAIRPDTTLVSIMHANNEIGTIEPVRELAQVCAERGVPFHTDACQSFGKLPVDVAHDPLGLVTLNAHKVYGPKGVGALYVRESLRLEPCQHGGGHEFGLRSSTENVPGIVGFAAAAELACAEREREMPRMTRLRDRIFDRVLGDVPGAYVNGHRTRRLATNVNLGFAGLEGEAITLQLRLDERGIAVATGSACSSHQESAPSHVLLAIGRDPIQARGAVRVTLGRYNTEEEIDRFLEELRTALASLRPISSVGVAAPSALEARG
ncbi:MAG TPA: cysteine desulfurase family protein [Thermoplasmata archaeon]|nr:cysteine desulfurase family protein [Thermoplasmata archaeon]